MNNEPQKKPGCLVILISGIFSTIITLATYAFLIFLVFAFIYNVKTYGPGLLDSFLNRDSSAGEIISGIIDTKPERLPNVPSDLQEHRLLSYRGYGDSKELEGSVVVLTLFVHDPFSQWNEIDKQRVMDEQYADILNIQTEAGRYGVTLNIIPVYEDVYAPTNTIEPRMDGTNISSYRQNILTAGGLPAQNELIDSLKELYGTDEAAVMFYTNTVGTSLAYPSNREQTEFEHTFMFKDGAAFQHELFHVFGAYDLYTPPELKRLSTSYIDRSVMRDSSEPCTDSLTAYLIGWTDTPSPDVIDFLYATSHITDSQYQVASAARPKNGFYSYRYENGEYTGNYLNGQFHGQGKFTWYAGGSYEGNYFNGKYEGYGVLRYANGSVYEGSFSNGACEGYGTITWTDGSSYQGAWVNDQRTGYGTLKWANGDKYVGNFVEGNRTGYGTYYWPDGSRHEGNWVNDSREGYGIHTYANGKKLKGNWVNDKYKK